MHLYGNIGTLAITEFANSQDVNEAQIYSFPIQYIKITLLYWVFKNIGQIVAKVGHKVPHLEWETCAWVVERRDRSHSSGDTVYCLHKYKHEWELSDIPFFPA